MKIWSLDYGDRDYTDAVMLHVAQFRGMTFMRGIRLSDTFPRDAVVQIRSKKTPTDYFKAGTFWILSSKLKSILDTRHVEAEYFSVKLMDKVGQPIAGDWFCFNPTLVVDWFDRSKSKFTREGEFATGSESIGINEHRFGDVPLAVALKTIPVLVGVDHGFADSIESCGCTGVVFWAPEQWQNPTNPVR